MKDDKLIQAMRRYNIVLQHLADMLEENNRAMLDLAASIDRFRTMWAAAKQDYETLSKN